MAAFTCALAGAAWGQTWSPMDLDPGHLLDTGGPNRIHDNSVVVGYGSFAAGGGATVPVRFDPAGPVALPLLPGDELGVASDVNAAGVVVGTSTDVVPMGPLIKFFDHPVRWQGGVATDLRGLVTGGATHLELLQATGINAAGLITCTARDPVAQDGLHGVVVDGGTLVDLGDLWPGGAFASTTPVRIDDLGRVVGSSDAPGAFDHAFLWDNGVMHDLHDPVLVPGRTSRATDIDRFGNVCGSADFIGDLIDWETAALWRADGTVLDLGTLGGGEGWAYGMNDLGVVVGGSVLANGENRAFVWQGGVMTDLNARIPAQSGWLLLSAQDVNNAGRIVGVGLNQGVLRPFVLEPQCGGTYTVLDAGCAAGAHTPVLSGVGCAAAGSTFALDISGGPALAPGLLLLGLANQPAAVHPACVLHVLPLVPITLPIALDATGSLFLPASLPPVLPPLAVVLQAPLLDATAPGGIAATNNLLLQIP